MPSIRSVLELVGHRVSLVTNGAEVIPLLSHNPTFDVVVLSMLQHPDKESSFDVVKEMCQIPTLNKIGKVLVLPRMADPEELHRMYGDQGFATFDPPLQKTMAVNECNLEAIHGAIEALTTVDPAGAFQ